MMHHSYEWHFFSGFVVFQENSIFVTEIGTIAKQRGVKLFFMESSAIQIEWQSFDDIQFDGCWACVNEMGVESVLGQCQ